MIASRERETSAGAKLAGERNLALLRLTRQCIRAKAQLRHERIATVDDVYEFLADLREDAALRRNSLGRVFDGPEWEFTGCWTASRHRVGRQRLVRIWRLLSPEQLRGSGIHKSTARTISKGER